VKGASVLRRLWRIPGQDFLDALEETGAPPSALVDGIADRLAVHG